MQVNTFEGLSIVNFVDPWSIENRREKKICYSITKNFIGLLTGLARFKSKVLAKNRAK